MLCVPYFMEYAVNAKKHKSRNTIESWEGEVNEYEEKKNFISDSMHLIFICYVHAAVNPILIMCVLVIADHVVYRKCIWLVLCMILGKWRLVMKFWKNQTATTSWALPVTAWSITLKSVANPVKSSVAKKKQKISTHL